MHSRPTKQARTSMTDRSFSSSSSDVDTIEPDAVFAALSRDRQRSPPLTSFSVSTARHRLPTHARRPQQPSRRRLDSDRCTPPRHRLPSNAISESSPKPQEPLPSTFSPSQASPTSTDEDVVKYTRLTEDFFDMLQQKMKKHGKSPKVVLPFLFQIINQKFGMKKNTAAAFSENDTTTNNTHIDLPASSQSQFVLDSTHASLPRYVFVV